jgi:hypothetical protein
VVISFTSLPPFTRQDCKNIFWYRGPWIAASLQYERRRSTEVWVDAEYPVCEVVAMQLVTRGDSEMSRRSNFPKQSYLRQGSAPSSTPRVTLNSLSCSAVRIGFNSSTIEMCAWSRCVFRPSIGHKSLKLARGGRQAISACNQCTRLVTKASSWTPLNHPASDAKKLE